MLTKIQIKRNEKFIAALRSGKYKQTGGVLRKGDKFCCLGVACEVKRLMSRDGNWISPKSEDGYIYNAKFIDSTCDPTEEVPPESVQYYYGWPDVDPVIKVKGTTEEASQQNDKRKRTFKQIADGFERWLKEQIKEATAR